MPAEDAVGLLPDSRQATHCWNDDDPLPVVLAAGVLELADEVPEDGPAVLRVRITAAMARAFSRRANQIVSQGRPPCPLCGLPLDSDGHVCPRQNGHRTGHG